MSTNGLSALQVSGLFAGYRGREVIQDLTLPTVQPGQVLSLIGPNAAGKSTLLRALAGLLPARGSVKLGIRELLGLSLSEHANFVTYTPQELPQQIALTVLETVISALQVVPDGQLTHDEVMERSLAVLERLGISHLAMEELDHLSGGQRQLTSLAQTLVRQPRVLLLDEPISALDLHYQLRVMKLVREVAQEQGMIVVVVLHDLSIAARWSDQVVVLAKGQVVAAGTPEQAITPQVLSQVYHVSARIERCSAGSFNVLVDDVI